MESSTVDVPRVSGRHRNTLLASERRRCAVELALGGMTYQHVAEELGYTNRGTVHRIVTLALRDREAQCIDELRALEVDRLDALQTACWSQVMDGDTAAASLVVRIIDRRRRLLGLYGPPGERATEPPVQPQLIDPADLVACPTLPADQHGSVGSHAGDPWATEG